MNTKNLLFSKDHEWIKMEGKIALVGISNHAQESLGDIVFIALPKVGQKIKQGQAVGSVESVKAVSEII